MESEDGDLNSGTTDYLPRTLHVQKYFSLISPL